MWLVEMTCSWTDVCRGPGDEVRLSRTWASLHTGQPPQLSPALPNSAHQQPAGVFLIQIFCCCCFIKTLTVNTFIRKTEQVGNTSWDGEICPAINSSLNKQTTANYGLQLRASRGSSTCYQETFYQFICLLLKEKNCLQ